VGDEGGRGDGFGDGLEREMGWERGDRVRGGRRGIGKGDDLRACYKLKKTLVIIY